MSRSHLIGGSHTCITSHFLNLTKLYFEPKRSHSGVDLVHPGHMVCELIRKLVASLSAGGAKEYLSMYGYNVRWCVRSWDENRSPKSSGLVFRLWADARK